MSESKCSFSKVNMKRYMACEWFVLDTGIDHPLVSQYRIKTRDEFESLKKDGQPYKVPKAGHRTVFGCYSEELAEHLCFLHNMKLRDNTEPLHELIEKHLESAKEKILQVTGVFTIAKEATIKKDVPSIALRLIHNCQFTRRVENILEWAGIKTLGELSITSPRRLTSLRMFGATCLREVRRRLRGYDIDWDKSIAMGVLQMVERSTPATPQPHPATSSHHRH